MLIVANHYGQAKLLCMPVCTLNWEDCMQKVNLDDLAAGTLPKRVVSAIGEVELTIEEIAQWEASKARVRVVLQGNELRLYTRACLPLKKAVATLGGLTGLLWATAVVAAPYLPQVQDLLNAYLGHR